MRVIGTAGHVDHGKSTLIEALTGYHPDRLKEEREREMTIDLGFAWLDLPAGEPIGIVDVPGHRDFIGNMLAGIGGIDAALFVVAADEGVMPQTREHLAILDILQIFGGVIALTKIDMVSDLEWLDLVEEEVRGVVSGTVLKDAPIVRVSARNGTGLKELLIALEAVLQEKPPRQDLGRPRLPVDRVFSISGFGTVVTGTMNDGHLRVGDEVEILPEGTRGRIRGLQTHKEKEDIAIPGSRTAVNISGVGIDDIERGNVVAHPGDYQPTRRMDLKFRLLADLSQALRHNTEVKLFIGSAQVLGRARILGQEEIQPGHMGWLQLETRDPVVAMRGDRYILRRPSPGETLGGGSVVDPHPKGRHKRFTSGIVERLEMLSAGEPEDIYLQTLAALQVAPLRTVTQKSNLESSPAQEAFEKLYSKGDIILLEAQGGSLSVNSDILITTRGYWDQISATTLAAVSNYHQSNPLRRGMPKEELKSKLKVTPRLFSGMVAKLKQENQIEEEGPILRLPSHAIKFSPQQEENINNLLHQFSLSPYSPPPIKESKTVVGEDVYQAMIDLEILVPVSPEVVFKKEDYDQMVGEIKTLLSKEGTISAAQVRDHFNTSRRYALALLEHLDDIGLTIRTGDVRRLK